MATQVLCQSRSLRAVAEETGLVAPGRASVLGSGGNGVDLDRFTPSEDLADRAQSLREAWGVPPGAVVVAFVGRLVADKGFVELERAWRGVSASHPGARLVLVGPWEPRDPVPRQTRRSLETRDDVVVLGERDDVEAIYSAVDLVVLPSHREGFPNVPVEAAAMGRPTVVTNVEGCVDAVRDGVTGTVVARGDVVALSLAIRRYIEDAALRHAHGRAARDRVVRAFDREQRQHELLDYYEAVLAG
jgi:glycosyltransferase involved in cell wall biosynthesis